MAKHGASRLATADWGMQMKPTMNENATWNSKDSLNHLNRGGCPPWHCPPEQS